jgi:hypothetical protein
MEEQHMSVWKFLKGALKPFWSTQARTKQGDFWGGPYEQYGGA